MCSKKNRITVFHASSHGTKCTLESGAKKDCCFISLKQSLYNYFLRFMTKCQFWAKSLRLPQENASLSNYSVDLLQKSYNIPLSTPLIKNVVIPISKREEQLKIYEWRSKTEFPIVKILDFAVIEEKNNSSVLEIWVEVHATTLSQVHQLPLFKALYLLKEAIIGLERLFDRFGPFLCTPSMIVINAQHKCKVWINQNFYSNDFLKIQMSQQIFLGSIYRIFEQRSNKLKNTTNFFLEISKRQTFYEALSFIQIFAKRNRINIPQYCTILPSEKINQYKITGNTILPTFGNRFPKRIGKADMRLSLKAAARNRFIPSNKEGSWNANKSGGDTAPDIENSRSQKLGKCIYSQKNQEINISQVKKQNAGKEAVFKSEVPIKISPISSFSFGRKYNSNIEFLPEIKSLNLQPLTPKKQIDQTEPAQQKQASFGEINDEQNDQTTKIKQQEVYSRNHWQRSIKFLLNDLNVKSSVHLGQDIRKTQKCAIKLQRLDTIRQKVTESFINIPGGVISQADSILFGSQL